MSDLKLKTRGVKRDGSDIKDYEITANGRTFFAQNTGKGKFVCLDAGIDRNSSLKDIKMAVAVLIENGEEPAAAAADGAAAAAQIVGQPTWNQVDPCVLLIRHLKGQFGLLRADGYVFDPELKTAFDDAGWLNEAKTHVDMERYRRLTE